MHLLTTFTRTISGCSADFTIWLLLTVLLGHRSVGAVGSALQPCSHNDGTEGLLTAALMVIRAAVCPIIQRRAMGASL